MQSTFATAIRLPGFGQGDRTDRISGQGGEAGFVGATFTNTAAAVAAGITAAKFPRRIIWLSAGGTGAVPCLAVSDGTNWKQVAIGVNAI